MPLNKIKGNMYDDITHTWNPLGGECAHKCSYCSTKKLMRFPVVKQKYTGEIRLIESEFKTNLGKGNKIFVCAQSDLFANAVPNEFILSILKYCRKFDNEYLFQTKNPIRILDYRFNLPEKSYIATTIESNNMYYTAKAPHPIARALAMRYMHFKNIITIEPITAFQHSKLIELIKDCRPFKIYIGADTGHNNLLEPSKEYVLKLIDELKTFTEVKIKKNLNRILKS